MIKNVGLQLHSTVVVEITVVSDATPSYLHEDAVGEAHTYSCYRTLTMAQTGYTFTHI